MRRAFLLLLLVPTACPAFAPGGHRIIAELAWDQLAAEARTAYVQLLRHHPRLTDLQRQMPASVRQSVPADQDHWLFLEASVWPGRLGQLPPALRAHYDRPAWHRIELPIFSPQEDGHTADFRLRRVNLRLEYTGTFRDEPTLNLVEAIHANLAGLTSNSRTPAERAVHLCWVLHLVADAHLPVQASSLYTRTLFWRGDQGGRRLPTDRGTNLNQIWNRLLPTEKTLGRIASVAAKLRAESPPTHARFINAPPRFWVDESRDYAFQHVYTPAVREAVRAAEQQEASSVTVPLSSDYLRAAGSLTRRRAVTAAARLSHLLQEAATQTNPQAP